MPKIKSWNCEDDLIKRIESLPKGVSITEEVNKALRTRWNMWNDRKQDRIIKYVDERNKVMDKIRELEAEDARLKSLILFTEREQLSEIEKDKELLNDPIRGSKAIDLVHTVDNHIRLHVIRPRAKELLGAMQKKMSLSYSQAQDILEICLKKEWLFKDEEFLELTPTGRKMIEEELPEPDFSKAPDNIVQKVNKALEEIKQEEHDIANDGVEK